MNYFRYFGVALTLQVMCACSFLPGMSASYYKPSVTTKATNEASQDVAYQIYRVNQALIQDLKRSDVSIDQKKQLEKLGDISGSSYKLGPQDVLRITVWGHPDLSPMVTTTTVAGTANIPVGRTIDHLGELYFPLVGNIKAAGLTIPEFRSSLIAALSKYLKDPQVEIEMASFRSQRAFLSGEVKVPGVITLTDQPLRVTDAIGLAGGYTNEADLTSVVFTRGNQTLSIDLDKMYFTGDMSLNLFLRDGDVITVPDRQSRKVYVMGEVGSNAGSNNSKSYIMRRGNMSLSEVISDAGGPNPFSSAAGEVYLMRLGANNQALIYQLDASQADALLMADQLMVKPRDIVYVSPTTATKIGRIITQFFPILQGKSTANSAF